jgi:hypothetical protein
VIRIEIEVSDPDGLNSAAEVAASVAQALAGGDGRLVIHRITVEEADA